MGTTVGATASAAREHGPPVPLRLTPVPGHEGAALDTAKPTTLDAHKDVIRRWIEFSNGGFAGSFDDFISADYVGHLGASTIDRQQLECLERQFCDAFPDAHHAIDDLVAEGDRVVLRTTARATHLGFFEGIDATGRGVEFTGLVVYRIENGRIAESWGEIDFLRLMRDLRRA